jgi:hypothetical protein
MCGEGVADFRDGFSSVVIDRIPMRLLPSTYKYGAPRDVKARHCRRRDQQQRRCVCRGVSPNAAR